MCWPTRTRPPTSSTVPWRSSRPASRSWPWLRAVLRPATWKRSSSGSATNLQARLLVVSDDPALCAQGTWSWQLPAGLPEWLMPIVSIVPGQLHAMHLTMAKGRDPEQPRSIAKVTRTS